MAIKLSEHFTYGKLVRYVIPSIWMMIIMSIYYVVDGYFVSNYVGKVAFAAVNLLTPAVVIPSSVAFMFSAGGAAVVATTMGEGRRDDANRYFSMLLYVVIGFGAMMTLLSEWLLPYFLHFMEADGDLFVAGMEYGWICLLGLIPFMLQVMLQALWSTAEKPQYGLYMTVAAGVTNLVLDYVFIVLWGWGITGAAVASVLSQVLGGLLPLVYFYLPNSSALRLVTTAIEWPIIMKAATNGFSEMLTSISASILGILYNLQLMSYIGADGVAAYGVMLYANGTFESIYFGYGMGASAIISYHFGARNTSELHNVLMKSLVLVGGGSLVMTAIAYTGAGWLTYYFVGYDAALWQMTKEAFRIYCLSFILAGMNGFASAFFTALNNGRISAVISMSRILIFQVGSVLVLPMLIGMDGIWWSVVIAEVATFFVAVWYWKANQSRYGY